MKQALNPISGCKLDFQKASLAIISGSPAYVSMEIGICRRDQQGLLLSIVKQYLDTSYIQPKQQLIIILIYLWV